MSDTSTTTAAPTKATAAAKGKTFLQELNALGATARADVLKGLGLAESFEKAQPFIAGMITGGAIVAVAFVLFHAFAH